MILNIETSTSACSLSLQDEEQLLASINFFLTKSHSTLLPSAIGQLLDQVDIRKDQLTAIGISEGPGSYTGLRIGSSTAKALAFGLDIPVIAVGSLDSMVEQLPEGFLNSEDVLLPMIDARRMEIYVRIFNHQKNPLSEVYSQIVDENAFAEHSGKRLIMFGDGAKKVFEHINFERKVYLDNILPAASGMTRLVYEKFKNKDFVDVAYFEPLYVKDFQTKKSKDLLRP